MVRKAVTALASEVGRDEVMLLAGLCMVAKGVSMVWAPGAWLVPGLILLWAFMPPRPSFLVGSPAKPTPKE